MGDPDLAVEDLRQVALEALGRRLATGHRVRAGVDSGAVGRDTLVALERGRAGRRSTAGRRVRRPRLLAVGSSTRMLLIDGTQAHPPPGTVSPPDSAGGVPPPAAGWRSPRCSGPTADA